MQWPSEIPGDVAGLKEGMLPRKTATEIHASHACSFRRQVWSQSRGVAPTFKRQKLSKLFAPALERRGELLVEPPPRGAHHLPGLSDRPHTFPLDLNGVLPTLLGFRGALGKAALHLPRLSPTSGGPFAPCTCGQPVSRC